MIEIDAVTTSAYAAGLLYYLRLRHLISVTMLIAKEATHIYFFKKNGAGKSAQSLSGVNFSLSQYK